MVSMRNKKNYLSISIKYPSYLELCIIILCKLQQLFKMSKTLDTVLHLANISDSGSKKNIKTKTKISLTRKLICFYFKSILTYMVSMGLVGVNPDRIRSTWLIVCQS